MILQQSAISLEKYTPNRRLRIQQNHVNELHMTVNGNGEKFEWRLLALSSLTQLVIVYPEAVERPASATSYRLPSAVRRLCLQSANLLIDNLGWR